MQKRRYKIQSKYKYNLSFAVKDSDLISERSIQENAKEREYDSMVSLKARLTGPFPPLKPLQPGGQIVYSLSEMNDAHSCVALLLHFLRNLVTIRILPLWCDSFGGLALFPDIYLSKQKENTSDRPVVDIWYRASWKSARICNTQLLKMWERRLIVIPLADDQIKMIQQLPDSENYFTTDMPCVYTRDPEGLCLQAETPVAFTDAEIIEAQSTLAKIGIPPHAKFVCFHARDEGHEKAMGRRDPQMDFDKQAYDQHYRDSGIQPTILAMSRMAALGYYVIRMGKNVTTRIQSKNSRIIDYASSEYRSDFMDIYILSKCEFSLTGDSGIYTVPLLFRRPIAITNSVIVNEWWTWCDALYLPKHFWYRKENRYLTLSEVMQLVPKDGYVALNDEFYEKEGIDLIENTAEEIASLAMERSARISGKWVTTGEDEALQSRFWNLFAKYAPPGLHGVYRARIGMDFLRTNNNWLN